MIRRFGTPPLSGVRYGHRPGAYAILPRGSEVLVTHQADPNPEFQLPGGGIDPGEGAIAALHREVMEETGWIIARPQRFTVFRNFTFMPDYDRYAEKICHIYIARPVRRVADPTEPGHDALWMPVDIALGAIASPGDRHALEMWLG